MSAEPQTIPRHEASERRNFPAGSFPSLDPARDSDRPVPSELWRRLALDAAPPGKLPGGLDAAWNAVAGRIAGLRRREASYLREAALIRQREEPHIPIGDEALRASLGMVQERIRRGRQSREDVLEAFALLSVAATRTLGLRPHLEQLAAGLVVHDGCVAEMATGEGKTLAVSIPTVIAGWRGRGCHVLTFNGYLAGRDAEAMRPLYDFCGVRAAHIDPEMQGADRGQAYLADITYCTNQDVAADFLRDRLALGRSPRLAATLLAGLVDGPSAGTGSLVMRSLDTAIIDEGDSILIDEAVTPLIISGDAPNAQEVEAYETAAGMARDLRPGDDYTVDHRYQEVALTKTGQAVLEKAARNHGGVWAAPRRREELVTQALTARELFERGRQYIVEEGAVVIVDEATGRLMPDRTWRAGLHQAIEAKEGLEVNSPKDTLARISFQRFFRMYRHLSGMTGTAWEARHELWQIYGLPTVVLPTHQPCRRELEPDRAFPDQESKWDAVVEEIRRVHAEGRPILVGTRSVEASERLSRRLAEEGLVRHEVLNAVRHAEEAGIVARAGERGRITVATNMAGRGTDIKLGPGVADLGGLHVVAVERHESGRVDRQLFGRSARQGDPGSAVAFVSLEDDVARQFAPAVRRQLARRRPDPGSVRGLVTAAQRRAERHGARLREAVLRTDAWLDRFLGFAGSES